MKSVYFAIASFAGADLDLRTRRDTAITMAETGSAMMSASTNIRDPSNRTCFPVSILQIGRKMEVPLLTNRAQNRYTAVPATILLKAALLLGVLE